MINPCKDCITYAICRSLLLSYNKNNVLLSAWNVLIRPKCDKLNEVFNTIDNSKEELSSMTSEQYKRYEIERFNILKEVLNLYTEEDIESGVTYEQPM